MRPPTRERQPLVPAGASKPSPHPHGDENFTSTPHDYAGDESPTILWADLVKAEPRLAKLEAEVLAEVADEHDYCANAVWYRHIKPQFHRLIGWGRHEALIEPTAEALGLVEPPRAGRVFTGDELIAEADRVEPLIELAQAIDRDAGRAFLWESEAYEVGYQHLYHLLPNGRDCGCW